MNIPVAIVGYGKMGRMVEKLAPEYGFVVCARLSKGELAKVHAAAFERASIAIEFTNSVAAVENLERLAARRIRTVCGTTGWYEQLPQIRNAFHATKTGLVYGPNFSIGVNLFLEIVAHAASIVAAQPEYESWGWEIHHSEKRDVPSGTLKKLAEEIRAAGFGKALSLSSSRAGAHPGTHEIGFDSAGDTITLRHTARNREGFARGALQAARWLMGKEGVHEFRQIFGELAESVANQQEENTIPNRSVK
jgi:4-hydroxy-tetrahydrodipicolinate reductase